jgi:hypothetical protein
VASSAEEWIEKIKVISSAVFMIISELAIEEEKDTDSRDAAKRSKID